MVFFNKKENPLIIHGRLVRDKTDGHTEEGRIDARTHFCGFVSSLSARQNNLLILANN